MGLCGGKQEKQEGEKKGSGEVEGGGSFIFLYWLRVTGFAVVFEFKFTFPHSIYLDFLFFFFKEYYIHCFAPCFIYCHVEFTFAG